MNRVKIDNVEEHFKSASDVDIVSEKCKACGGQCCKIYQRASDGGSMPESVWFEEWCEAWTESFEQYMINIPPLFDPLVVHANGNEDMIQDLISKGIDPYSCQYRGENGCLIPRHRRPVVCRTYMCNGHDVETKRFTHDVKECSCA